MIPLFFDPSELKLSPNWPSDTPFLVGGEFSLRIIGPSRRYFSVLLFVSLLKANLPFSTFV